MDKQKKRNPMSKKPFLLNDDQMQRFVRDGYIALQVGMPVDYNEALCARVDHILDTEGNPGNNIIPRVPELQDLLDNPVLQGALLSVLGSGYYLHPHRYYHGNDPGMLDQTLHKDATTYSGDEDIRDHRCRWVMVFYYPHEVAPPMGPTAIQPGTQYYETLSNDPDNAELLLYAPAGTAFLVHFDLWHRGRGNAAPVRRHMLKLVFGRTAEPKTPSWNATSPQWHTDGGDKHPLLWRSHWNWLRGESHRPASDTPPDPNQVPALVEALGASGEADALNAAYALSAVGSPAIPALVAALREDATVRRRAALALSLIPGADSALRTAAADPDPRVRAVAVDALAEQPAQDASVAALVGALDDSDPWVRRHAADALGTLGSPTAADGLARRLADPEAFVRHNAATALMKLGPSAAAAVPALIPALRDPDRYTRAMAGLALRRIGGPEATEALLDTLLTERWCAITNSVSRF